MGRVYLDHASTSPPRPEVVDAFTAWMGAADPGRVHTEGRMARVALEDARANVAALFGTRPRQVIFTSGGTEAINAAIFGATAPATTACRAQPPQAPLAGSCWPQSSTQRCGTRRPGRRRSPWSGWTARGTSIRRELLAGVGPETALVHCQWGNHEVATLQPVAEVAAECRRRGVFLHVDAAAAAGHVPINFDAARSRSALGVGPQAGRSRRAPAPSLSAAACASPRCSSAATRKGGGAAGMEDVAAWVGFGEAARILAAGALEIEAARARAQTAHLLSSALAIPGVRPFGDTVERLPHLICVGVDGVEAEAVLLGLDQAGVAAHSGSACSSESLEPSPVLAAMGVEAERSLRLSVGWSTTDDDVQRAGEALPAVIDRLRRLASSAG